MVTRQEIQATCDDIVRQFAPLQVILFGSYAYGTPTEDSDSEDTHHAMRICAEVRQAVRTQLKLEMPN